MQSRAAKMALSSLNTLYSRTQIHDKTPSQSVVIESGSPAFKFQTHHHVLTVWHEQTEVTSEEKDVSRSAISHGVETTILH